MEPWMEPFARTIDDRRGKKVRRLLDHSGSGRLERGALNLTSRRYSHDPELLINTAEFDENG